METPSVVVREQTYTYTRQSRHAAITYQVTTRLHADNAVLQEEIMAAVLQQAASNLDVQWDGGRIKVLNSGWDIFFEFTGISGQRIFRAL